MLKIGIEAKVILLLILFTLIITFIERYETSSSIEKQFIISEESKADVLLNTLSPIVSLNISLGLDEANSEYLDEIQKQNRDILILRLKNSKSKIVYEYNSTQKSSKIIKRHFYSRKIVDSITNEKIGTLELYLSNRAYQELIKSNNRTSFEILFITLILLMVFIYFLRREFYPLKKLTTQITQYNPTQNNFHLEKLERGDEVGIIHNAIVSMVERIENSIEDKKRADILLEQQSKMASLGEMLASISHQWKQPLAILSSINIKLKLENDFDELSSDSIELTTQKISKQIEFMTQTLNDFSSFYKPKKSMVSFSIVENIEKILNIFGKEYEKSNIEINITQNSNREIKNYSNEFQQVVLNILNNARDAIVETDAENRAIDISVEFTTNSVKIYIQDYAGGIEESVFDSLFDPFVTTKKEEKGTGIGLYMSKRLLEESMQGSLSVTNIHGGACFLLELPLYIEETKSEVVQ